MKVPSTLLEALFQNNPPIFLLASFFLNLSLNLLLLFLILYQIINHFKTFHKLFSKINIIFFLLLLEVALNLTHTTFNFTNTIYLLDTYIRHVIFIYLIYYFVKKSLKLNERQLKRYYKKLAIVLIIICLIFFSVLVLFFMIYDRESHFCKKRNALAVRVAGIVLSAVFIFIGYQLISKYFKEMNRIYRDFWDLLIKDSLNQSEINILIDKQTVNLLKNDENMYDMCKIIGYHMASALLTTFLTVYSSFLIKNNEDCSAFEIVFQNPLTNDIYFNVVLAWLINFINYYLPLIMIINVFWLNKKKQNETSLLLSISEDLQFINNLQFKKSLSKINNEEEEEEKSCVTQNLDEGPSKLFGKSIFSE